MSRSTGCFLLTLLFCTTAVADPQSRSYSNWTIGEPGASGVYTVASREITRLPAARYNPDLAQVLQEHLAETVTVANDAGPCDASGSEIQSASAGYTRIAMRWMCPPDSTAAQLTVRALLDVAPSHIHFARIRVAGQPGFERLFTRHQNRHRIDLGSAPVLTVAAAGPTILTYSLFGFEHILIGLDHIAFLLTLMLLAQRLRDIIFIVSGFTLGHSLTLSLTVLGLATPNTLLVEALIGFTIAMVAVENVSVRHGYQNQAAVVVLSSLGSLAMLAAFSGAGPPVASLLGLALFSWCYLKMSSGEARARQLRPAITTLFGLIHGFGFASVLLEVGLPDAALVPALFGFNLGVEIGQLAIVFGLAVVGKLSLRLFQWREGALHDWSNAALCGLGTFWFVQRLYF